MESSSRTARSLTAGDTGIVQGAGARRDRRLWWGGVAFLLYGICWLPALVAPHPPTDPGHNRAFALAANQGSWRLAYFLAAVSLAPLQLGLLALNASLTATPGRRWSVAGLLWTIGLAPIFLTIVGFGIFVVPAVGALVAAGQSSALRIMDQTFTDPLLIAPFVAGILVNLGLVLFGVGVWRSATLPRWSGVLLGLLGLVSTLGFLDVNGAQRIEPALALATGVALAGSLWRQAACARPVPTIAL